MGSSAEVEVDFDATFRTEQPNVARALVAGWRLTFNPPTRPTPLGDRQSLRARDAGSGNLYTDGGTSAGLMMGTITLPFDMEAMAAQAMETLGES